MRLLLDTHALLWWLIKSPLLPISAQTLLQRREHFVFVSAASAWEMATKVRLGRLDVAADVIENFMFYVDREEFRVIPVTIEHGIRAGLLPGPHKDPFDRMLIAQALSENAALVSNDRALDGYGAKRLW